MTEAREQSTAAAAAAHPLVQGRCPACGGASLFLGSGGYLTCSRLDCPQPDAATEVIADFWEARQHGAFTFCPQDVGHVTMAEFARKISEKRTALAQREEAVRYANEQRQRADQAEAERDEARQHAAAIAAQRDRLRQRMNTLADRWDNALAPDKPYAHTLRNEISVAPFDPEGAMTVQEYTERGRRLWAFRCWGTDTCDGWLGLGHHTQSSALIKRERHVAEEHAAPTPVAVNPPGSTVEQLPDHVLAQLPTHPYLSTACQTADAVACTAVHGHPLYDELRAHAERLHGRCRLNHKFTGQPCTCGCHPVPTPAATGATNRPT